MAVFYLIRHAHADWTPDEQRPLSSAGLRDADRLADLLCDLPITRIHSSPYQRARQTITPLADRLGLPLHIEPDLRERKLGAGPTVTDFLAAVEQTWHDPTFAHLGGETNAAAQRRGVAVVGRLQKQHSREHLVLSTHGNLLALVLQGFDARIDFAFWRALSMPDVYELQLERGEASITRLWQSHG
jgi:2,3-bisphosphoglycerate-dependent phosphoglycerate mutase